MIMTFSGNIINNNIDTWKMQTACGVYSTGTHRIQRYRKNYIRCLLVVYIVSMLGNVLQLSPSSPAHQWGTPCTICLAHLSFIDACQSCVNTPKVIIDSFYEKKTNPFNECMTQVFGEHIFAGADVILLTVMAYDRYAACI